MEIQKFEFSPIPQTSFGENPSSETWNLIFVILLIKPYVFFLHRSIICTNVQVYASFRRFVVFCLKYTVQNNLKPLKYTYSVHCIVYSTVYTMYQQTLRQTRRQGAPGVHTGQELYVPRQELFIKMPYYLKYLHFRRLRPHSLFIRFNKKKTKTLKFQSWKRASKIKTFHVKAF